MSAEETNGGWTRIPLSGPKAAGRSALVDDEDLPLVAGYRWFVFENDCGRPRPHGPYAVANTYRDGKRTRIYMHALIAGHAAPDHINHDGLDNRRSNLRVATGTQNMANKRRKATGSSRYKGVYWHKQRSKWMARIKVGDKEIFLGRFVDEMAAAQAYDAAATAAYSEYALVNFPTAKAA